MIQVSVNLPKQRRLDLSLVKKRGVSDEVPLFPELSKIKNIRSGSRISRFFRHIFEHKNIRRILGVNLSVLVVTASLFAGVDNDLVFSEEESIAKVKLVLTTEKGINYPVEGGSVSQGYKLFHPGIDIDSVTGVPVTPIMDGEVEAIQYSNTGYGNAVLIDHGNQITSLYTHLSKIFVQTNDDVSTETTIGAVGATGRASGDHLHLEIRDNGYPLDPATILP
jgi:murein DD-endopeptidase MepM/ murein hydrolase activator NlpD